METWIVSGMLVLYGIEDIKKRTISVKYLVLFGIVGVVLHFFNRNLALSSILLGLSVGVFLIILSFLTKGNIGMGDGFVFLVTGIFLGGSANLELLAISLLYAAVFSLGIIFFGKRKKNKNREIPFIPFVFAGYLTLILEAVL